MLKSAVASEEAYSRFMTEAQAVGKLNHANIVSIYDIGKEDGKQFFVLEFVDGESLRDLMQTYPEGKCDIETVLRIGMDVCKALQYAHSEKVLHRDIKPENVMITKDGTAKLMDFGLATLKGSLKLTRTSSTVGTLAYMAPEQIQGGEVDARSDIFSLGVVLYEMIAGRAHFRVRLRAPCAQVLATERSITVSPNSAPRRGLWGCAGNANVTSFTGRLPESVPNSYPA
jgi:serine/threonine-protein kinase